jgi:hypothetical protein
MIDLFWNVTGVINCAKHAPMRRSDTWNLEQWQKMRAAEVELMQSEGIDGCEVCRHEHERTGGQS